MKCTNCKKEVLECDNCQMAFSKFDEIVCCKEGHFCSASCFIESVHKDLVYGEVE